MIAGRSLSMRTRRAALAAGGLALLMLAGPTAAEVDAVVTMSNSLQFEPAKLVVQAGDTVEWRNTSLLVHTVTADPDKAARAENVALPAGAEAFDSGNIEPEGRFRHTFETAGHYRYFCIPHEGTGMTGTIEVRRGG